MESINKGDALEHSFFVQFRFTTFDTRRSMLHGREGSMSVNTTASSIEIDNPEVKALCVSEVNRIKPKWNILSLDIKSISPLKAKNKKTTNG